MNSGPPLSHLIVPPRAMFKILPLVLCVGACNALISPVDAPPAPRSPGFCSPGHACKQGTFCCLPAFSYCCPVGTQCCQGLMVQFCCSSQGALLGPAEKATRLSRGQRNLIRNFIVDKKIMNLSRTQSDQSHPHPFPIPPPDSFLPI